MHCPDLTKLCENPRLEPEFMLLDGRLLLPVEGKFTSSDPNTNHLSGITMAISGKKYPNMAMGKFTKIHMFALNKKVGMSNENQCQ